MLDVDGSRGTGSRKDGDGGAHEATTTNAGASTPLCQEGEAGGSYLVRTVPVQISRNKVPCTIVGTSPKQPVPAPFRK